MIQKTAVVLGITADIGRNVALRLLSDNWCVIGLGKTLDRVSDLRGTDNLMMHQCDVTSSVDIYKVLSKLEVKEATWDLLFSSIGTMEPIGNFFELDFDDWQKSVDINFLSQMRLLHGLWPMRRPDTIVDICLLAGGGTNGPMANYSAYCVSKIALIKMCELIDDEAPEANCFIIGPGFTRTKMHIETLRAGKEAAGQGYDKTLKFYDTPGTSFDDIYAHLKWCMEKGRDVAGGRNHSTVYDNWRDRDYDILAYDLRSNKTLFKLRRKQ